MQGLMMETPLLLTEMIRFAAECHGEVEVVARDMDDTIHRYTYAEAERRAKRLAQATGRLGIRFGDVIGALGWNTHRYFELFYGISGTGAVLHTINPRLFEEQLVYIINHAEDRWLFIDIATIELAERLAQKLETVEGYVFMGPAEAMPDTTSEPTSILPPAAPKARRGRPFASGRGPRLLRQHLNDEQVAAQQAAEVAAAAAAPLPGTTEKKSHTIWLEE